MRETIIGELKRINPDFSLEDIETGLGFLKLKSSKQKTLFPKKDKLQSTYFLQIIRLHAVITWILMEMKTPFG